ncbi:MAG: DUF402 domain-containing protein [Acidobacteria bacterium]|nr:DUF402 domain-containing protein [Acidobacteriota bacterium]
MNTNPVTINARKYDKSIHRSWKADLIETKDTLLTFVGKFDKEVVHPDLGTILAGTISYEYYWLDRWYNIFRFHHPNGDFRNFYCNINMPPTFENGVLDYVDLEIDLLVESDASIKILDEDEFELGVAAYGYSTDTIRNAKISLKSVIEMIENRVFPFDIFD